MCAHTIIDSFDAYMNSTIPIEGAHRAILWGFWRLVFVCERTQMMVDWLAAEPEADAGDVFPLAGIMRSLCVGNRQHAVERCIHRGIVYVRKFI